MSVSADTIILTDQGYKSIRDLTLTNSATHNVWNGEKYTPATFVRTGTNKQLLQIDTAHGYTIRCTPYHNFITINNNNDEVIVKAKNLTIGDRIQNTNIAGIDINYQYNSISRIMTLSSLEDVYGINEPILHRAVKNSIMLYN